VQSPVVGVEAVRIDSVRQATRSVLRTIDDLTDAQADAPCRLPGWSRAELITHLARNADGIRGMVEGAARGEVVAMYPGGLAQRAEGIAAGRGERAANLRSDLRRASDNLVEAFEALPPDAWDRIGQASKPRTMRELTWVRWREVEVHHADLDLGYEVSDWPVRFVTSALAEIFATFPERAAPARPVIDIDYRVISTDHERTWRVVLRGPDVHVLVDDGEPADGEARGWGCDIAAWLYGRDPRGGGIVASGDLGVLRLPQWFPFA
jgi:maleylpyruvate isomerase